MSKLFTLINYRVTQEKPTIITANKALSQLVRLWTAPGQPEHLRDKGMAVLSRIRGMLAESAAIQFRGSDQRWQNR